MAETRSSDRGLVRAGAGADARHRAVHGHRRLHPHGRRPATPAGARCSRSTSEWCAPRSSASAAARSSRRATASSPPSTALPGSPLRPRDPRFLGGADPRRPAHGRVRGDGRRHRRDRGAHRRPGERARRGERGARVADRQGPGGGLRGSTFWERGTHELKGVPDSWELYSAAALTAPRNRRFAAPWHGDPPAERPFPSIGRVVGECLPAACLTGARDRRRRVAGALPRAQRPAGLRARARRAARPGRSACARSSPRCWGPTPSRSAWSPSPATSSRPTRPLGGGSRPAGRRGGPGGARRGVSLLRPAAGRLAAHQRGRHAQRARLRAGLRRRRALRLRLDGLRGRRPHGRVR